jgi:hypothetical protein
VNAAAVTAPRDALATIDQLLRDRNALLARIRAGVELAPLMRAMVATLAVCCAIVGAALGSYRGGVQIAYGAIKLPLVLLGTAALSAPTLTAIGVALGRRARLSADLALVMSALAFGSLLLVAATPLFLLCRALEVPYHDMILIVVGVFATSGFVCLGVVSRSISAEGGTGRGAALLGLCTVFALVGGQLAWALRPYLVRPRATDIVFVRDVDGSLVDSIATTFDSARGIFAEPIRSREGY